MKMSLDLIREVNEEIERALAKGADIDALPGELLNAMGEEWLEAGLAVVHAVNREPKERAHEEIVQAIGVLVRLDEAVNSPSDATALKELPPYLRGDDWGVKTYGLLSRTRQIVDEICSDHGVSFDDLRGTSREYLIRKARSEAYKRLRDELKLPWATIAFLLGRKSHSTPLRGYRGAGLL